MKDPRECPVGAKNRMPYSANSTKHLRVLGHGTPNLGVCTRCKQDIVRIEYVADDLDEPFWSIRWVARIVISEWP